MWPGSRRAAAVAVLAAVCAIAASFVLTRTGGGSPSASHASAGYGHLPSWLPKPRIRVNRIAHASTAHPWLAIEGDSVVVALADGRTTATAVGPAVPEEGQFPVPPTTRCTFTLTFTATTGTVPLNPGSFTILDEYGKLHHPRVVVSGAAGPPVRLEPGRTVSLTVTDVLPTGNGQLRWTPVGATPIASWDFDVEID